MCWETNKIPIRNIATKNIICYKIFHKNDVIFSNKKFLGTFYKKKICYLISLWRKYTYIPYKINPKININCLEEDSAFGSIWCINEGYHSYKTLNITKKISKSYYYTVKCIIPKNSVYYINNKNEIVSSAIIITDKVIN